MPKSWSEGGTCYWRTILHIVGVEIDAKRHAFLWTSEKTCSGGHCKAPWDLVYIPKDKGGLGIKDLHIQNRCVLQKFLSKVHEPPTSPWQFRFISKYGLNDNRDLGDLWRSNILRLGLPFYKAFGTSETLLLRVAALPPLSGWTSGLVTVCWPSVSWPCSLNPFSRISVAAVFSANNPQLFLRNCLSSVMATDLSLLLDVVDTVLLDPSISDSCLLRGSSNLRFSTAASYYTTPSFPI